jgi:predicted porin
MKKSLVAVALFGAFAAQAQAQSAVVIYGTLDAGVSKSTGSTTEIGGRDNNKLGFMGTEDLGNGLKALFQLEMRYTSDTGMTEGKGTRPLFQGQSRVGLQGAFGTVRLGRGLTAFQESSIAFEPWSGIPSKAGFQTDIAVAGYTSDPLSGDVSLNSRNRFSNAVFYNTPVFAGFQGNATVGTKEKNGNTEILATPTTRGFAANAEPISNPYSLSGTYNNGMVAAMAAYERNAVESKIWSVAGSVIPMPNLKLMASYQQQDQGSTMVNNEKTKAWVLGANYTMGPGKFLAGYGQKDPEGVLPTTKQVSLGYEYSLSKRTYVYVDASNKKQPLVNFASGAAQRDSVTSYGVGVHHNF